MKKLKKKDRVRLNKQKKQKALDEYNSRAYYSDIEYLGRLNIPRGKRDWIEMKMYELRASANIYEHNVAEFLLSKGIRFVHQAPFVFYGEKIYFADFYLPDFRLVIEVDGEYHLGDNQFSYDKERDSAFRGIKIQTIRLANAETKDKRGLGLRLSQFGI